jgi:hypothetical protein
MEKDVLDFDLHQEKDNSINIELISTQKFAILSFLSLGLYCIWWSYKVWKYYERKDTLDIMPAARALFLVIFGYSMFQKILNHAQANGYTKSYPSALLIIGVFVFNLTSRIEGNIGMISVFFFIFLFPPLLAFNYAVEKEEVYSGFYKSGFNGRQLAIVIIGAILWVLIALGMYAEAAGM